MQPPNIHAMRQVANPSLSPDGSALVYTELATCADKMTSSSRLMICQISAGQVQRLTSGPKDSSPKHAPDGRQVGFLRPGKDGDKSQLWLISTSAGEARQLTHLPGGVRQFSWAADSKRLVVVSPVDPDAVAKPDYPQTQVVRRIRYRDDGDGWRGDTFSQLFIITLDGAEPRQLTYGEGDHLAPVWSPTGARIAYISDEVDERDFSRHSQVCVLSVDDGAAEVWSDGLARAGSIAWSPDGKKLVAAGSHDSDIWDPRQSWLYVLEAGKPYRIVAGESHTIVQPIAEPCWTADDQLVYIADRHGESYLCRTPSQGGDQVVIAGGDQTFTGLALDGKSQQAALIAASNKTPGDLAIINLQTASFHYTTSTNRKFLQDHPAAAVEKFSFHRKGWDIQSRLLFPPDFDASKQYPLVLDIHGGPNGRFSDSYDLVQQLLAGAGYLVLAVNPRGSSSYGPQFLKAVLRDWGGEDFLDLMAAVDLVCQRPYVDPDRLGVHGYSYGGFMSSWIIGHDHRFKAAVIGAPCTNLHSMYGTSDIGVSFGENQWGGSSFKKAEALVERSPLTYASQVKTPALLLHGEVDYRCPIEQSEQFFVALKRQNKIVELVRFPGGSHGFPKTAHPKLREEYYQRVVDWFERFFPNPSELADKNRKSP